LVVVGLIGLATASALQCRQSCDETTPGGCEWFQQSLSINFYMHNSTSNCPSPWDSGCAWFKCNDRGEWWGCRANLDCTIPCPGGSKICGTADWSNAAATVAVGGGSFAAAAVVAALLTVADAR
jgi:hypothetical protein